MTRKGDNFDKPKTGELRKAGTPLGRPKDAATLILIRRDAEVPRVLMGKRSGRHDFMPDKYVFPGGRVDPQDSRPVAYSELTRETDAKLRYKTRRLPRAFAMTAIRETFEETGLLIGREAEMPATAPPGWQQLYDLDVAPNLEALEFVGRAITPPYRPKRFDARFFMADAETALIDDRPPVDGAELHDLQWVTLVDSMDLDLPMVTRFMLSEIEARLTAKSEVRPAFVYWQRGAHKRDRI